MRVSSERDDWIESNMTFREQLRQEALECSRKHRDSWRVTVRNANYSAFNGYHRTWSRYSELQCRACGRRWRTAARYVRDIPDGLLGPGELKASRDR